MTTPSSTDSPDRVEALGTDDAETELLVDTEPADEIVPELLEEDDLVEGAQAAAPIAADAVPGTAAPRGSGSIVAAGAAAIAAAGLALTSLGGNWLGSVLAERQTLLGQIAVSSQAPGNQQIKAHFLDPWHRTAFVGLGFAVAAIVIAGATLFLGRFAAKELPPVWVRALAWGALALAVVGLGVSAAMYFDVFTKAITVPAGG